MKTGTEDKVLSCRRALEALRSGVPNRDAVEILGCNQPHVERKFRELITSAAKVDDRPSSSLSMLVEGEFGSGKSHLLEHLEHMALTENFVCSRPRFEICVEHSRAANADLTRLLR